MSHDTIGRENIDIEEFERRMRGPAPRPAGDPLAELARLVTTPEAKPETLDALFARPEAERGNAGVGGIDLGRLRGSTHGATSDGSHAPAAESFADPHGADDAAYADEPAGHEPMDWAATPEERVAPPAGRSRRPLYLTAAVIGIGILGIGSTFAFKGHRSGSGDLVEVKADAGPVKVQAQTSDTGAQDANATVLDKGAATQPVTRAVDRQERPVDLKDAANRNSRAGAPQMASLAAAAANGDTTQMFPEPRRVKTVSVRPDGTVVGAPAPVAPVAVAAPSSSTPSISMPLSSSAGAKTTTPKTPTRVVTTPKPAADASDASGAKPTTKPATKPLAAKPAPTKVARVENADDAAETDAAPAAPAGGGFVVQLAAPGSEAEAKGLASRLSKKFADELGGSRITVQKAGDKQVYRVRTAAMSREGAVAACEKIKASGGACFVAKN